MVPAGKIPWATEVMRLYRGVPKTTRIPTGGWRSYGAVPSHSYPIATTLPDGYWQGLGYTVGTVHSQGDKGIGFGAETPTPTTTQQAGTAPWLQTLQTLATAATTAYTSKLNYEIQRDVVKAGGVPQLTSVMTPTPAGAAPAGQAGPAPTGVPWMWIGLGAVAIGAVVFLGRKRRR